MANNKQIQVSTVKQTADVEVIFVNANLISKAIRSSIAAHNALDKCMKIVPVPECDEDGTPKRKENGELIVTGKTTNYYDPYEIGPDELKPLCEIVLPFLDELCKAFEE